MADTKTRRGVALGKFRDAGTGETFEKGATVNLEAGAYGNYERAGLVGSEADAKADAKTDAKVAAAPAA